MLVVVGVTEIHIQCLYVYYNDLSLNNFFVGAVAIRYVLLLVWGAFYQFRYPLANSWHCNALRKWRSYPFSGNHAMASVNSTVCCGKSSKNGLHHFSAMARYIPYPIPPSPHPPNPEARPECWPPARPRFRRFGLRTRGWMVEGRRRKPLGDGFERSWWQGRYLSCEGMICFCKCPSECCLF